MNEKQLIKDFFKTQKGITLDAIKASWFMKNRWGISIDWHEFAFALDIMEQRGEAKLLPISSSYRKYRIL